MTWECGTEQWLSISESMMRIVYHIDCVDPTEPDPIIYDGDLYASSVTVTFDDADPNTVKIISVYREYYVNNPTIIIDTQTTFFNSRPSCTTNNTGNAYWQICNTDLFYNGAASVAQFYICNDATGAVEPGGDPGEGGSGDGSRYFIVQYFDTTSFGYTGGCVLRCEQDNPFTSGGECTVPTTVRMSLYPWGGSYTGSLNNDVIISDDFIIESEKVSHTDKWIPFFWGDLEPEEYIWTLQVLSGPHDGTFSIHHDDNAGDQKYPAWLNGYDHYNFKCDIFGLDTDMTYERIITNDDSFGVTYGIYNGNPKIKTKISSGYNNTPHLTAPYNSVTMRPCYLSTGGNNLSFEEPTLTGWDIYAPSPITIERSEDVFTGFPTDGAASIKTHVPFYSNYGQFGQYFTFTNCTSSHNLHFDYYVPSTSPGTHYGLLLQVYVYGVLRYQGQIDTQGVYPVTITNVPGGIYFYLSFKISSIFSIEPRTIYIDNIRFTGGGDYSMAPVGRMVGGSIVKTSV